jgi:hypothetical protein
MTNAKSSPTNNMPIQYRKATATYTSETPELEASWGQFSETENPAHGVWTVPQCELRQVRTNLEAVDSQNYEQFDVIQVSVGKGAAPVVGTLSNTYQFSYKTPSFESGTQNKTGRDTSGWDLSFNGSVEEEFDANAFENAWGVRQGAADFVGLSGIRYPGKSGQRLNIVHTESTYNQLSTYQGRYRPLSQFFFEFPDNLSADIDALENNAWIDAQTALVQVGCYIWNSNTNQNAYAFYSVEFLSSGRVLPNPPKITVAAFADDTMPAVDIALVFAFFYLSQEVQELVLKGPMRYFFNAGIMNLVDLMAIFLTFGMAVQRYVCLGMTTSRVSAHYWTLASCQSDMGILAGLAMFCVLMKLVKFTKNVPIMCRITDTFGDVAVSIAVFMVVMMILFAAFGMLFNMIYSLNMV